MTIIMSVAHIIEMITRLTDRCTQDGAWHITGSTGMPALLFFLVSQAECSPLIHHFPLKDYLRILHMETTWESHEFLRSRTRKTIGLLCKLNG